VKKNIAILGSTGSIGKSLLNIISKDQKKFNILLLSANKNYKKLFNQAKKFNVKNIVITDEKYFKIAKSKKISKKLNIYNNFNIFNKIFRKKIDYIMSAIVGLDGLEPTYKAIKYTKIIAIANKESIICGWNLINKRLKKYKTQFIPVDSEHFSIWYALKGKELKDVKKIYLTASGGPLLNIPKNEYKNFSIKKILKHPNWKMGKKISTDSSTMMNKVFEVVEAKNIFNLKYDQLDIVIHPKSYVHAIIKYNDGIIKLVAHDTTMEIPIHNSIYFEENKPIKTNDINFKKLNNLNFQKIDKKKFTNVNVLNKIPNKTTLFETVIVATNDELVKNFLEKKISFTELNLLINKIISRKDFEKFKYLSPRNVSQVVKLSNYVRNKINALYSVN